ncbi:acyl-CoA dehydrogenase family protein [Cupriavidus basilensis]
MDPLGRGAPCRRPLGAAPVRRTLGQDPGCHRAGRPRAGGARRRAGAREKLTAEERGEAAVAIAAANVLAGEVALQVSSEIFEVTGARSAVRKVGLDRFWRNARIHTLHNPSEYKTRNVGRWVLGEGHPEPGTFQ